MRTVPLNEVFKVKYGVNLELNKLKNSKQGINFVSRTSKNNGVSAVVTPVQEIKPNPGGVISVSGGGSVLEAFLQTKPFYSGRDLFYLTPKIGLTDKEKLIYCTFIRANKYKYNYGRQANKSLGDLLIPHYDEIKRIANELSIGHYPSAKSQSDKIISLTDAYKWKLIEMGEIFEIKKGKRFTKSDMRNGSTPFIGAVDSNNGYRQGVSVRPDHPGGQITVNYNGSVAESFYQPVPFKASDDVNVLYPKFDLNQHIAMFLNTIIRNEKYRFNYGRKWHKNRMKHSRIKLPVTKSGTPDWQFMEGYIKSLPYSSNL